MNQTQQIRVLIADDQLVSLAQNLAAFARLFGGPAREGGACCIECGLRVLDGGAGDRRNLVLGRRIDHVEAAAVRGFPPLAADPQIGRDVREQIIVHGTDPLAIVSCPWSRYFAGFFSSTRMF